MSAQKTISNSFTVTTMESPVSVQAQYAPNNNPSAGQIHNVWQDGDLYMRTRETDSNVWSSWHKIVGENGDETDFSFGISAYKRTTNATTAPSDISSWSDAPLAVTSSKPYLWAKVQKKSWNASTQSYDVDSTTYIRLTGEDGSSVMAQYAPNNNPSWLQIHDTWQSGDLYMRTTSTTDSNWSSWHKIVGENGDETEYSFNISKSKTSTNSTTAPSDCYYTDWQDAPVAPTSTYPYMWMKIVKKTWNESTQSYDSGTPRYARVTGEKGGGGVNYCFVFTKAAARVDENNKVTAELAGYAYKYVGGVRSALTSTTIRYGYILTDSDTYTNTTTNSSGFFDAGTWFNSDYITDYGKNSPSIFAAIVIDGTVVHAEMITISIKGGTGNRGKVGRFFYYAGELNDFASTDSFLVNDAQAPYFHYNNNYWVFNPETNGTYTKQEMGTPSSSSSNWKVMTSDFKYIITEAIFGSYAHFGSFIISGDWLISSKGTQNGSTSNNYLCFDEDYPNTNHYGYYDGNRQYNFIPNVAIDGESGQVYMQNAYLRGTIEGVTGSFKSLKCVNYDGEEQGRICFHAGYAGICFESTDLRMQGPVSGRYARFYAADMWVRGGFGAFALNTAIVIGNKVRYYVKGIENSDYVEYTMSSASGDGHTYYTIPLCPTSASGAEGFAVDLLLVQNSSDDYYYKLSGAAGKKVRVINVNDNTKFYMAYMGGWMKWEGGETAEMIYVGTHYTGTCNRVGKGWFYGAYQDNNWH